jgi:hypothetical protein
MHDVNKCLSWFREYKQTQFAFGNAMRPSNTPPECRIKTDNESCRLERLLSHGINILHGEDYLLLF